MKPRYYPIPADGPVGQLLAALGRHPNRPAHFHYILKADGFETLITHIFDPNDSYIDSDAVFGVKQSLCSPISRADFTFAVIAADWGCRVEETTARLMQESPKAQENGEAYAFRTARAGAAAVNCRGKGTPSSATFPRKVVPASCRPA